MYLNLSFIFYGTLYGGEGDTQNLLSLVPNFEFNKPEVAKKKGNAQRRKGKVSEFEFIRPNGQMEDLQDAIQKFINLGGSEK